MTTVAALLCLCMCASASPQWKSSVDLEIDGDLRLSWTPKSDHIVFQVEARTLGFLGVGFSEDGSLKGADVVVGWVEGDSQKAFLLDYHGVSSKAPPQLDPVQNYELLEGSQNKTHTVLRFQRPWDTCDTDYDRRLGNNTERIIWAMGKEDPNDQLRGIMLMERKDMWKKSRSVHLINIPNPLPADYSQPHVKRWDVVLNNFSVPDNMDTLYWCKIFKVPPLSGKHHIIGYEPVISHDSKGLVHHMLLYECVGGSFMDQYLSHPGAACDSDAMPSVWERCVTPAVAWAVSSSGEFLPDHVGIPLGESKRSSYFMLEVHYDNPTLKQVKDSSGLRLFYTDKLREHEGAMLVTGVVISPMQVVPPHQKAYKTAGYCDFYCTDSTLPSEIKVISALLHSHRAGRQITMRHVRGGVELTPIAQDNTYDFNYQQSRVLVEEKQILPGDEIITECVYNTESRTEPTLGGYSTKQEMCLGFITYYPRSPLASCLSMTPVDFFFQTFGVKKFYHYNMSNIENMFLRLSDNQIVRKTTSTTPPTFPKLSPDDEINEAMNEEAISTLRKMVDFSIDSGTESNLFDSLIIEEPEEFRNRSFTSLLHQLPWAEQLLTRSVEKSIYRGKHMTFCRLYNDSLQTPPQTFKFPNFTELKVPPHTICPQQKQHFSANLSNDSNCLQELSFFVMLSLCLLSKSLHRPT